jgi:hypothetical protein
MLPVVDDFERTLGPETGKRGPSRKAANLIT